MSHITYRKLKTVHFWDKIICSVTNGWRRGDGGWGEYFVFGFTFDTQNTSFFCVCGHFPSSGQEVSFICHCFGIRAVQHHASQIVPEERNSLGGCTSLP